MSRSRSLGYGEGSVYQEANGRWRGEIRRGMDRRRVSGLTRRDVVQKLDQVRSELDAGLPFGRDVRLGDFLDWYRESVIAGREPATRSNYEWAIRQLKPVRGYRLRELDVAHVEQLLQKLSVRPRVSGTGRGGRSTSLGKSSLTRVKTVLGAALHEAERRGLVLRNVARLAHLPPNALPSRERRALTPLEARLLISAVEGSGHEALIWVALTLGLPPGEVIGLPWRGVDFDAGTLTVAQAMKRHPDGLQYIGPPKSSSYRIIQLPTSIQTLLRQHQIAQRRTELAAQVWENNHELVFTNAVGRPIDSSNLRRLVKICATNAGLGHLSPNELRHSAASLLVEAGTPLAAVADLLGHSTVRMLTQTYRHKVRPVVDVTAAQEVMFG